MPNAYDDATPQERAESDQIDRLTGLIHDQEARFEEIQAGMLQRFGDIMESIATRSQDALERRLQEAMQQIDQRASGMSQQPQNGSPQQRVQPNQGRQQAPPQPAYQSQLPPQIIERVANTHATYQQAMNFVLSLVDHAGLTEQMNRAEISPDNVMILYGKATGVLK